MAYTDNIVPSAGWPTVPTPADGDAMDGTNETTVQQALTDRTQLLYARLMPLTISQALNGNPNNDAAEYDYVTAGANSGWESQTTNANEFIDFWFSDLPDGATLATINAGIRGTGAYGGTPAVKNTINLARKNLATGALTLTHTGTDPATFGVPPLMTDFRLVSSSPSLVVDRATTLYGLRFGHESGANAQAGVQIQTLHITITRPTT